MKIALLIALIIGMTLMTSAQKTTSDLQAMVDTERAFARMAEEQGIRPAFMSFIAEDGVLFRPKAVKGKQWMTEHPLPPSDKKPLLTWRPSFADMALAGDMGYTFGPWEFKNDVKDAAPSGFGHFVTVWKKQSDGSWKFAVDLGVSHPESQEAPLPSQVSSKSQSQSKAKLHRNSEGAKFEALEREFSERSLKDGGRKAFLSFASSDVRLFREGKIPVAGKELATAAISETGVWTWQPEHWDVSQSEDLAYSYGTYQVKDEKLKLNETGNYYRIWKRENGTWQVVLDLANPVPAK